MTQEMARKVARGVIREIARKVVREMTRKTKNKVYKMIFSNKKRLQINSVTLSLIRLAGVRGNRTHPRGY